MAGSLEVLKEVLSFPLYLFTRTELGYTCDKLVPAEKGLGKTRYLLIGTNCTCPSFMKGNACKHQKMLKDDHSWIGAGVDREVAMAEATEIVAKLGHQFPDDARHWVPDPDAVPERVACLSFGISGDYKKVERIVCMKQVADRQRLGVQFVIRKSS